MKDLARLTDLIDMSSTNNQRFRVKINNVYAQIVVVFVQQIVLSRKGTFLAN